VTQVTVTAGKPSEFKFKLSKAKIPAVGTVVFKVTNGGKIGHDFTINGKKTPVLAPGKSATLTVVFNKKGSYVFKCSVKGHADAGMVGSFGVAVAAVTPPPPPTSTVPKTACASPQNTTVAVDEFDFGFTLSLATVPCGTVTFNQKNSGAVVHNFHLQGVPGAVGALIDPGKTTTMTVQLTPSKITYVCDVSHHDELGMIGQLVVTG
jgi:uncharacterized cupredoxin-like copper-binding protein